MKEKVKDKVARLRPALRCYIRHKIIIKLNSASFMNIEFEIINFNIYMNIESNYNTAVKYSCKYSCSLHITVY